MLSLSPDDARHAHDWWQRRWWTKNTRRVTARRREMMSRPQWSARFAAPPILKLWERRGHDRDVTTRATHRSAHKTSKRTNIVEHTPKYIATSYIAVWINRVCQLQRQRNGPKHVSLHSRKKIGNFVKECSHGVLGGSLAISDVFWWAHRKYCGRGGRGFFVTASKRS